MKINTLDKIIIDPDILMGKPVFKNTRIPVYVVLDLLADSQTEEDILKLYPDLTKEDIKQALLYASYIIQNEDIYEVA